MLRAAKGLAAPPEWQAAWPAPLFWVEVEDWAVGGDDGRQVLHRPGQATRLLDLLRCAALLRRGGVWGFCLLLLLWCGVVEGRCDLREATALLVGHSGMDWYV